MYINSLAELSLSEASGIIHQGLLFCFKKGVDMSRLLTIAGAVLVLLVVGLKIANTNLVLGTMIIHLISLLVLANIAFTLAILFKK